MERILHHLHRFGGQKIAFNTFCIIKTPYFISGTSIRTVTHTFRLTSFMTSYMLAWLKLMVNTFGFDIFITTYSLRIINVSFSMDVAYHPLCEYFLYVFFIIVYAFCNIKTSSFMHKGEQCYCLILLMSGFFLFQVVYKRKH